MVEYNKEENEIVNEEKVKNLFEKAKDLTKKYAIKSKKIALKLYGKAKEVSIKVYNKVKPIALKLYENLKRIGLKAYDKSKIFAKKNYGKIEHAIKQKKQHGRPLILELPLYVMKDMAIGFYTGIKEGYIMYKIRRSMKDREVE